MFTYNFHIVANIKFVPGSRNIAACLTDASRYIRIGLQACDKHRRYGIRRQFRLRTTNAGSL